MRVKEGGLGGFGGERDAVCSKGSKTFLQQRRGASRSFGGNTLGRGSFSRKYAMFDTYLLFGDAATSEDDLSGESGLHIISEAIFAPIGQDWVDVAKGVGHVATAI